MKPFEPSSMTRDYCVKSVRAFSKNKGEDEAIQPVDNENHKLQLLTRLCVQKLHSAMLTQADIVADNAADSVAGNVTDTTRREALETEWKWLFGNDSVLSVLSKLVGLQKTLSEQARKELMQQEDASVSEESPAMAMTETDWQMLEVALRRRKEG